jgi:hypothetical protein
MGAYTAFLDLALGLANPALGLVAARAGLPSVFLAGTLVVVCAAVVGIRLLRHSGSTASRLHRATAGARLFSHGGD